MGITIEYLGFRLKETLGVRAVYCLSFVSFHLVGLGGNGVRCKMQGSLGIE